MARRTRSFVRVCIVAVSVISSISTTWEAIIMALVTVQRSPSVSNSPQSSVSFCSLCVFTGTCRGFLSRVRRLKHFYTIARSAVPETRCAVFNVVCGEPFLIWWCIDSRTWKGNEKDVPNPPHHPLPKPPVCIYSDSKTRSQEKKRFIAYHEKPELHRTGGLF